MKDQRLPMTVSAMVLAALAGSALAEAAPDAVAPADAVVDMVRAPDDLPRPLAARGPEHVVVDMETVEVIGQLADGATYRYWTYNEQIPGTRSRRRYRRGTPDQ